MYYLHELKCLRVGLKGRECGWLGFCQCVDASLVSCVCLYFGVSITHSLAICGSVWVKFIENRIALFGGLNA